MSSHETIPEVSKIGYLTWWNFPKKAWLIIIGELAIITSLSVALYITYLSNVYFQTYVNSLSPILVPVLSVAFGISSASIATYLYLGMKRIRTLQEPETPVKKRIQQRKTPKRLPPPSTSQPKGADSPSTISAKLKSVAPPQSHVQSQKPPMKEREDHNSNPDGKKQP
ncbi:MAG TPA: hypothetical protein VF910_07490 [Candidatus Bathyarchaeia archaeon]